MKRIDFLASTLQYFAKFQYPPSLTQIHKFYEKKISKADLIKLLTKLVHENRLLSLSINKEKVYADPKQKNIFNIRKERLNYSTEKLALAHKIASILGKLPQLELIGLSGSVAMMNAKRDHDIDFFIITKPGNLWTCRAMILLALQILGIRRGYGEKKVKNKICCNLYFDGRDIKIKSDKISSYMAHEVLQMIPLVSKKNTYLRFINQNNWVFNIFPNATKYVNLNLNNKNIREIKWLNILNIFEKLFQLMQLTLIMRHRTTEFIGKSQLWFFK